MIILPLLAIITAVVLDLVFGDPPNRYHPTAWIGKLIGKIVPNVRSSNPRRERLTGSLLVIGVTALVSVIISISVYGITYLNDLQLGSIYEALIFIMSVIVLGLGLKTTFAVKGMEQHTSKIMAALARNDLEGARANLSMIVKRSTKDLDRQHIISATLESLSENIVDGITGPFFYFTFFGPVGAFVYRTINTVDSMIGYKTPLFNNLGWFGANCDKILNFLPSRLTALVMVIASILAGGNWRNSIIVMLRDAAKTTSPNAGFPMAVMAGLLEVRFEKFDHYILGDETSELQENHFRKAISVMKLTAVLFLALFTIPMIIILSYMGWWNFV